ncbi:MAG: hypothetical protein Q4F66_05895 [Clostridium sp.]|nr:hypothetical protein [Clostridium sp.]
MEKKEFLMFLKDALQNQEVIEMIKAIGSEQLCNKEMNYQNEDQHREAKYGEEKESQNRELQKQLELIRTEKQKLEIEKNAEIQSLQQRINKVEQAKDEIAADLQEAIVKVQHYESNFSRLNTFYSKYMMLSKSVHEELRNVIKADNAESFLCSGAQWDNLEPLWDFISYKLDEYSQEELQALIEIFNYFFEEYNTAMGIYTLLDVYECEEFDEDLHTRASNSLVSGTVSKVLLRGYKNIKNGRVIKKSIVRV